MISFCSICASVFDTPYHVGNSPLKGVGGKPEKKQFLWAKFLTFLRQEVCVRHRKMLFFRTWNNFDGWRSTAEYYLNVTEQAGRIVHWRA